jgi:hypothetical protein
MVKKKEQRLIRMIFQDKRKSTKIAVCHFMPLLAIQTQTIGIQ